MNTTIYVQPSMGIPGGPLPAQDQRKKKPVAAVIRPKPRQTGKDGSLRLDQPQSGPKRPHTRKFDLGDYVKWLKDKIEADRMDARNPETELNAQATELANGAPSNPAAKATPLQPAIDVSDLLPPSDTLFSSITDTELVDVMQASPVKDSCPTGVRFEEFPALGYSTERLNRVDAPHSTNEAKRNTVPKSHVGFTESQVTEDTIKVSANDTDAFISAVSKAIASVLTERAEPELEQKVRAHFETELHARSIQALATSKPVQVEAVEESVVTETTEAVVTNKDEAIEDLIAGLQDHAIEPVSAIVEKAVSPTVKQVAEEILADSAEEIPTTIAAWDVEDFRWPLVTNQMIVSGASAIDQLSQSTFSMLAPDRQRVVITGLGREAGTSSIAITLSRWVAALGKRVLLVDADISKPSLSDQVGLAPNLSWINAVSQGLPAAEVIVRSQKTNLCIMPLAQLVSRTTWPRFIYDGLGDLLDEVRDNFDLVVIDAGPSSQLLAELSRPHHLVDATLMVHDGENSAEFRKAKSMLEGFGLSRFIVAKNRTHRQASNVA